MCARCKVTHRKPSHIDPIKARAKQLRQYGLTIEEFEAMRLRQAGACCICGIVPDGNLNVDHCHRTGHVRGLLCGNCNRMIGLAKDSPAVLSSAAEYIITTSRSEMAS